MTTRVYLIRHGATELSAEDRFAGSIDVLLSETGRKQARLLAEPHGIAVTRVDELREIDHGRWEGRTRAEVASEFREEYERWEHDPYTFAPAGGESGLQVTARALPRLLKLVEQHDSMPFVIVSHKATIRLLLSALLAFDPRKYRDRLDQSPAALNIIDFKDVTHARLMLFNDVSHYDR